MSLRKLSAPSISARRMAVSAIAAMLLSATGFSVEMAVAQQTPAKPAAPAAKPAAPAAAKPTAPPAAQQAAQQKPAPGAPAQQGPAPGAAEMPQLVYSPWAKFCGKGQDPSAKEVCFTGKDA